MRNKLLEFWTIIPPAIWENLSNTEEDLTSNIVVKFLNDTHFFQNDILDVGLLVITKQLEYYCEKVQSIKTYFKYYIYTQFRVLDIKF